MNQLNCLGKRTVVQLMTFRDADDGRKPTNESDQRIKPGVMNQADRQVRCSRSAQISVKLIFLAIDPADI